MNEEKKNITFQWHSYNRLIRNCYIFQFFFSTIATEFDSRISISNVSPTEYVRSNVMNSLFFYQAKNDECVAIIINMNNKKYDTDTFPTF